MDKINDDLLERFAGILKTKDLVVLVDIEDGDVLLDKLCKSSVLEKTTKNLVIISCFDHIIESKNHFFLTLPQKDIERLLELYRSYEVSNKIVLLSSCRNYGSIWNYVNSGLLSTKEAFEALLS